MAKKTKKLTRDEQLEALAIEINKSLGSEGKVYLGRDHAELERIPTGVLALDAITGGGLVRKHYLELYGEDSAGKTLLALHCVAAVQRAGGVAAWVVGEEFDDDWATVIGVDVEKLLKVEALTGDLMLETAATYIESGLIDLMVVDSVQAIGTKREQEAGVDSESYASAGAPQMWARFYRRTRSAFNSRKSHACIIGISQVRDPIGVFSGHGKPEPKPTGIRVIKHWKSISVYCKKGEPTFDDPKSEKRRLKKREFHLRCVKNKTFPPERISSFVFKFGDKPGIDKSEEAVRLGKVYGILEQRGKILQGVGVKVSGSRDLPATDQFVARLRKDAKLRNRIRAEIAEEMLK